MTILRETPIKRLALGIYDGPHATPTESTDGAVFLGIKNITDDGHIDLSEVRYIAENDMPRWTKRVKPECGDIVFTYEATLHHYAIIPNGFHGCLGRRVALIRPDITKVNAKFLLYYFLTEKWRAVVERFIITGATVDRIPIERFPDFPLIIPPLHIQERISKVISGYDDLIENNLRRIGLLENAARLIYKEWFVKLNFPGREHTKIMDGVPEGWEKKKLAEIAEINSRSLPSSFNEVIEYIDIASVTPGSINYTTTYDTENAPGRARRVVKHSDIIWSCVRPNRKSHAVIWNPPYNLIASTGFVVISPKEVPCSYLYHAVTTDNFVGYLTNRAKGAAYPAVVSGDFNEAEIIIPVKALLNTFNDAIEPFFDQMHNLKMQNAKLKKARDLLLPKLMSGEIAV